MLFNRLPLQIFDARHWNGFEGCWNLVKGNPMFSDAEIEEAEITISKYEGKSVQVAYDSMMKSLEDIKKQKAITALLVYCGIYSTYYYLEDGITPYQFISWAKDRDSILVPEDMLYWYERKKENVPSTQLSRAKKRITELETQYDAALQQIEELKQALADTRAELAEAKAAKPQQVGTVDATLWENSLDAACTVLVGIMDNGETGITKDTFGERMRDASPNKRTHTKADRLAWKNLPDRYKAGPGRPKK